MPKTVRFKRVMRASVPASICSPAMATRPAVTSTDLVAGVPLVVVSVVAVVSLATAHAHAHSLPLVAVLSALVLGGLAYAFLRRRPEIRGDRGGVVACLVCGALAAVMFLPGFSYGVADKDPGGYVAHAVEIARNGSYSFTDPALAHPTLQVALQTPGARLPGIFVADSDSGLIVPQFFHLWPALLATSYDVAGFGGVTATTPVVGVLAVMALVALLRRVGGMPAAAIGGVLLATNMMQVWQAKYPTTEMLAQALFVGSLLALVVAAQERWRPAAFVAGAVVGVGFLNRADGWLMVMLAAAALAALWASRRADGLVLWGVAGLAALLPYALWQAYGPAAYYTGDNGVPGLVPTLALLAVVAALAGAARFVKVEVLLERGGRAEWQRAIGLAVCGVCALLMALGFLRPKLFGADMEVQRGRLVPTYDEYSLWRLSWFLTLPAFALAGLGVAVVALRRWTLAAWAVVLPTLLLLPVYAWHTRNSSRLMWWGRRFASHVLPGLVVLVALALAFGIAWVWRERRPLRVPAYLAAVALTAVYLTQSWPLRSHDEFGGSFGVAERLSKLSGDRRGIYLWQRVACCNKHTQLWATPVWLERGELSVLLPGEENRRRQYVASYRAAFPDDPVFVVWESETPPTGIPGLVEVDRLQGTLPFWEESDTERPDENEPVTYDFRVYRVP